MPESAPQSVFGHKKAIEALVDAARSDRLHHTLLFSGSEGIGKRLIARQLAGLYFCEKPLSEAPFGGCGGCHACKTLAAGNAPDLLQIDCSNKEEASTDSVRELLWSLRLRPFSGEYRFLVFDNAHLLQGQAANVLLKSLEEPRPGTFFILVTSKPHLMLRTIHSRAQRWGFQRLETDELRQALRSYNSESINEELLHLSSGSIEAYQQLSEVEDALQQLIHELNEISEGNEAAASALSARLAKNKEGLPKALNTLQLIARHNLINTNELKWANFLYELGELDYYLLRRNFAPLYLLQTLLLRLSNKKQDSLVVEDSGLIEASY